MALHSNFLKIILFPVLFSGPIFMRLIDPLSQQTILSFSHLTPVVGLCSPQESSPKWPYHVPGGTITRTYSCLPTASAYLARKL